MKTFAFLALLVASAAAFTVRYDGYQVFEVVAKDRSSFEALGQLADQGDFDFWTEPRFNRATDIMAAPGNAGKLLEFLRAYGIQYRVKIDDVQKLIESNRQPGSIVPAGPRSPRYTLTWDDYYRYNFIVEFVNELAATYPNLVTVSTVGQSFENRDMVLVKISSGGSGKNAIFVDGGIHAREWISPAVVTYTIRELVENYAAHPELVDNVDWYFMPVINPDGYEYSHTTNRLWRKTRSTTSSPTCRGTDMNRNFGFHWDEGGSSDSPCQETFNGGSAFSEVESRVVRDTILSVAPQTKVYLTFHSYGQYWLTPWGYTSALPSDYDDLYSLAVQAVDALTAVSGTQYTIGSSTNVLYAASGGSDDWAKGGAGIKYSYTVELRDEGQFGFELPPRFILPTALETWEAVKVVANAVANM